MFFIGIAGGSGSGKTTLATKIIEKTCNTRVVVLHQDSYYLPKPPEHLKTNHHSNFDHPDAFDWNLLFEHLNELRAGREVEVPQYDFSTSRRKAEGKKVNPGQVLILEGIFSLWHESIRELMNLKIFLNVDSDIRFIRRLHRDVQERARNLDGIISQYYETVRPMHYKYLEPTKQFADIIASEETDIAADLVSARIKGIIE